VGDDPHLRRPDIRKAEALLGWQPRVSLHEGLRRTILYFREAVELPAESAAPAREVAPIANGNGHPRPPRDPVLAPGLIAGHPAAGAGQEMIPPAG